MIDYLKNVHYIIGEKFKKFSIILFILMLIGMILETVSLSLVIPFMSAILEPSAVNNFRFLDFLNLDINTFNLLLIAIILIFLLKSIFFVFLSWLQARFNFLIQRNIANQLFDKYINKEFNFFNNINSSKLITNIVNEAAEVAENTIKGLFTLLTDIIISVGVIFLLFYIEPLLSFFSIFSIIIIFLLFSKTSSKFSTKWGEQRLYHEGEIIKNLQHTFGGIKEIKLYNIEKKISEKFYSNNFIATNAKSFQDFMLSMPRILVELIAILLLVLSIFIISIKIDDYSTMLPSLALFTAAFFRVVPNINRIQSSILSLKYSYPTFKLIYNEIKSYEIDSRDRLSSKDKIDDFQFNKEIVVSNLFFSYDNSLEIFNNINCRFLSGKIYGITGESGIGKSSLFDLLLGLQKINKGSITVDGKNINSNILGWRKNISYVSQNIFLHDGTIKDNITFEKDEGEINLKFLDEIIDSCQLRSLIKGLAKGVESTIGEKGSKLSSGQRQRLGLARALYRKPKLLVLDESTNALDSVNEKKILDFLFNNNKNMTIIIVSHNIKNLTKCDKIFQIKNKNLYELTNIDKSI